MGLKIAILSLFTLCTLSANAMTLGQAYCIEARKNYSEKLLESIEACQGVSEGQGLCLIAGTTHYGRKFSQTLSDCANLTVGEGYCVQSTAIFGRKFTETIARCAGISEAQGYCMRTAILRGRNFDEAKEVCR